MSDREKNQEIVEQDAEVEGHIVRSPEAGMMRGPEAEKMLQRSEDTEDETPDVEGHLSLRSGPEIVRGGERHLDAE